MPDSATVLDGAPPARPAPPAPGRPGPGQRVRSAVPVAVSLALYALGAYLVYRPLALVSGSQLPTCACNDLVQQTWFTAWPAYAITHLADPFFTTRLNYPFGVNVLASTSMPLLGTLAAPITLTAGPVASLTLLLHLAFFTSATSCFAVVRSFTTSTLPAFLAGALYGFSPYMLGQGAGHLNLSFVPLPPVIFLLAFDLVVGRRWRPRPTGALLGLCAVAQFFISTEILASTVVIVGTLVVTVTVLRLARGGDGDREASAHARRGLAVAGLLAGLLLAYPIWFAVAGPQHVTGPAQPLAGLRALRSDLLTPVVPTLHQAIGTRALKARGTSYVLGLLAENGGYLGIPLLVVLVVLAVVARRTRVVQASAGLGLLALVLSLGARLSVDNHPSALPLPFDLLEHLPLLESLAASRFSLFVDLFAALVLGVGLDHLRRRTGGAGARRGVAVVARAGLAGLAGLALAPLFPVAGYGARSLDLPPYVVSAAATRDIPAGSAVLTYPYPIDPFDQAMLWQAEGGLRYSLLGGYAVFPGAGGSGSLVPPLLHPVLVPGLLVDAWPIGPGGLDWNHVPIPADSRATAATVLAFLARYRVRAVLVAPLGTYPGDVVRILTRALGPARRVGGMDVWTGLH